MSAPSKTDGNRGPIAGSREFPELKKYGKTGNIRRAAGFMTISECANSYAIDRRAIKKAIEAGLIPFYKPPRRKMLVHRDDVLWHFHGSGRTMPQGFQE